ncbi:TPA: sigma-70 family RNA polymerase sigma factor [Streptococcus suis]
MKYYLYVKGKRIPVDVNLYKSYWKLVNHEKYLQRREVKFSVRPFSDFEYDNNNFVESIADFTVDVEKIVETKMLLELLLSNLTRLSVEELLLIEELYYKEKTLRQLADILKTSPARVMRLRDKLLSKLKMLLEEPEKRE